MTQFYVVKKEIGLIFGSTTQNPNGQAHRLQPVGTVLELDSEAPNGNVWFFTPAPNRDRGKIDCGEVRNLVNDGTIVPLNQTVPEGKRFLIEDQQEYSLADMLVINEEDEEVVDWLNSANVGDIWPGIVTVTRIQ